MNVHGILTGIKHDIRHRVRSAKRQAESDLFWSDLARKIAPAVIEEFPTHLLIDNEIMVECIVVGIPQFNTEGYPPNLNPHILDELLDLTTKGCRVAYSFTLVPIPTAVAADMIAHAAFVNMANQITGKQNNPLDLVPMNLELDYQDFKTNYTEIHRRQQNMFHSSFIITMSARSENELRITKSHVIQKLKANRILFEIPLYRMLDTFVAAQPFPVTAEHTFVEIFSKFAALLAATRNPNSRLDDSGLYFGDDIRTGKNVVIDLSALAAQHLLFIGPTGSGKTFTLLMLLMRAHDLLNKRIIFTTPKDDKGTDYRAVAAFYGQNGAIIDIGPQGNNINPLQILCDPSVPDPEDRAYTQAYDAQKGLIRQFFDVWFKGTMTVNMESYLDECLDRVYESRGIIREQPGTWTSADTAWPVLADLRSLWEADMQDKGLGTRTATAEALFNKTYPLGSKGELSYMNHPTDIDLSADFIVIDMAKVPVVVQDAMNVLVTGIMGLRFRTDTTKDTIIAVDEAGAIMRTPSLAMFLLRTLTQGRSYRIALWLATQQTVDLVKAGVSDEFKTNMAINIVLGDNMKRDTVALVADYFRLDTDAVDKLMSCSVGEGLLMIRDQMMHVRFKPSEHELNVIKGCTTSTGTGTENPLTLPGYTIRPELQYLVDQHNICFDDWIEGDASVLVREGYQSNMVQAALRRGQQRVWIRSELLNGDMIGNQSIDHYATVLQIAGYLTQAGIDVAVNHYDDVDLSATIGDTTIAFEYERPGSHNAQELLKKKQYAETKYSRVVFIGTVENITEMKQVLGEQNVVRRGGQLIEYINDVIEVCIMQQP